MPTPVADPPPAEEGSFLRFFSDLGPGLITGAADDDPSGISTYSVAGASFGYLPLWTALFSFPLMTAVQLMCARLGMVTGVHAENLIGKRLADRFDTVKVEKNFLEPLEPNEHAPSL